MAACTRIINRMKAHMARLGIHGFKPQLCSAPKKLDAIRTPEGVAIPPNTRAELEREMVRLAMLREPIATIEQTRLERLAKAADNGPHAMVRRLARVLGLGIETADMLVTEVLQLRDRRAVARYSRERLTRAAHGGARRVSRKPATRASGAA